jgi:hypothetical protein
MVTGADATAFPPTLAQQPFRAHRLSGDHHGFPPGQLYLHPITTRSDAHSGVRTPALTARIARWGQLLASAILAPLQSRASGSVPRRDRDVAAPAVRTAATSLNNWPHTFTVERKPQEAARPDRPNVIGSCFRISAPGCATVRSTSASSMPQTQTRCAPRSITGTARC